MSWLTPARARIGTDLFTGLVVASVGIALSGLTWRMLGDPGTGPVATPAMAPAARAADLSPIIALAPFGSAAPVTAGTASGNLQLRGILLARPIDASSALISVESGPAGAYRIGQSVAGAIIDGIAVDHVVLRTADGVRTLGFPDRSAGGTGIANGTGVAASTSPGVAAIRALIPESVRGNVAPSIPSAAEAPPGGAAPSSSNGAAFLDSLGATVTPGGYRVGTAAAPAILAAGLRPGDVIESVNGTALGDATRDREVITGAMQSGSARIEILRDGRRMTVSMPLR